MSGGMLTYVVDGSCWATGGPEWFFDAVLISGMLAAVGFGWWGLAWEKPSPRPSRPWHQALSALFAVLLLAESAYFLGPPPPGTVGLLVALVLGTVAIVLVRSRTTRVVAAGEDLPGGLRAAGYAVRWVGPVMTAGAIAAAVGFAVAMEALGHPC